MSEQDKIYFASTDPEGRTVHLHKSTWEHVKKGHPEVKRPSDIKSTIQKPDLIIDSTYKQSLIYSRESLPNFFFNVVAKMDDKYLEGTVRTAYHSNRILRGDTIWIRKK